MTWIGVVGGMPMLSASATCASRSVASTSSRSKAACASCWRARETSGRVASPFRNCASADSRTARAESTELWATAIFASKAGQPEKGALDTEDDLLVLAVEAEVGCQQPLFGRIHGVPRRPKSRRSQRRFSVGKTCSRSARKKPLGATFLGAGKASVW